MTSCHKFGVLCIFLSVLGVTFCDNFPSDVKKCKYGDEKCLVQTINYLFENKKEGHPGINMLSIDPLTVSSMEIKQGKESPVSISLKFRDCQVLGFNKMRAHKVSGFGKDVRGPHAIYVKVPVASLIGDYTINGKVLILPITGQGKTNLTITDVELGLLFKGIPEEKDGRTFMNIDKLSLTLDISRLYMDFTNLFNGDKSLGDNMNLFLNENWKDIFGELKSSMKRAFAGVFKNVIATVFSKLPYEDYFEHD